MNYKNGHKCDYAYKSEILKKPELLKTQRIVSRCLYLNKPIINNLTGEVIMTVEMANSTEDLLCNDSDWIEAKKINNASYHRAKRLKTRIEKMTKLGQCIFLTLTFSDETLKNTTAETRKKYVKKILKKLSKFYIANVDYGGKNGREHYHAIILAEKIDYSVWHKYGAIKGEIVRTNGVSEKKLGKYISKLTNHAIKETTKRQAIIYSRMSYELA